MDLKQPESLLPSSALLTPSTMASTADVGYPKKLTHVECVQISKPADAFLTTACLDRMPPSSATPRPEFLDSGSLGTSDRILVLPSLQ